jgi:hypothetical protein
VEGKPKRRWLRFSLRTMFVLITAVSIWLGWTVSVVRERKSVLGDMRATPGFDVAPAGSTTYVGGPAPPTPTIPWLRKWLGDEAIESIWFPADHIPTAYEVRYLERLFPEATLSHPKQNHIAEEIKRRRSQPGN